MIKAVIFDLDDTLISERDFIKSGYQHIAKLLSSQSFHSREDIYQLLMRLFDESSEYVFNRALDELEINYDKSHIINLVNEYRFHRPEIKVFDDVVPCLTTLQDSSMKLGIISDGYAKSQRNKLEAININSYFDNIIVTDELGKDYWKPSAKSFVLMKEALDVEFSEMTYIGDNLNKDFVAPNQLGMVSIHLKRNDGIYHNIDKMNFDSLYQPTYKISTLTQLNQLL